MGDIKWTISIQVAERSDGGMRVWSDDLPGLILSGIDPAQVGSDIFRAIKDLSAYEQKAPDDI